MFLISDDSWEVHHLKKKGRGVFTKKDIPGGTVIGDYLGRVVADEEVDEGRGHFYNMEYDSTTSILPVDPNGPGVHLLNHSCMPNCGVITYKNHALYFAIRHIFVGEELTLSYDLNPPDEECNPCKHACHCKTILCQGTMHLSEEKAKRNNQFFPPDATGPIHDIGEIMQPLAKYPDEIKDYDIYDIFANLEQPSYVVEDHHIHTVPQLRKLIRETGRTIYLPKSDFNVIGILNGLVISQAVNK